MPRQYFCVRNFSSTPKPLSPLQIGNLALDGNGAPELPGSNSCNNPTCRGIVTINSDGSYALNQECKQLHQGTISLLSFDNRLYNRPELEGGYTQGHQRSLGSTNWCFRSWGFELVSACSGICHETNFFGRLEPIQLGCAELVRPKNEDITTVCWIIFGW